MILRGARLGQPAFLDALAAGCIPVVSADTMIMPFADIIDWKRYSSYCLYLNIFIINFV